jgi:hypothetical protein
MRASHARRIRMSLPKGSGSRSGPAHAAAPATAETAWLADAIPAWNMRSLVEKGNLAPPEVLAARLPFLC